MDRYVSPALQVPAHNELSDHDRIDLELRGVDHSAGSYAIRVFVNDSGADAETMLDGNVGYAGSFYIFGHGPCLGDEGHCDVRAGPINPYDYRLPHQLTRQYHRLQITDAIRRGGEGATFTVTLVAVENRDGQPSSSHLMAFKRLSVVAYS
jgi:hypothetical protein